MCAYISTHFFNFAVIIYVCDMYVRVGIYTLEHIICVYTILCALAYIYTVMHCNTLQYTAFALQCPCICVAVCCSVLQCITVSCNVLKRVEKIWCPKFASSLHLCCSVLQCVAVCCSVLQCAAMCCSVLQCVRKIWWTKVASSVRLSQLLRSNSSHDP